MDSTVRLSQLYISSLNVRQTDREIDIESLADNIAAHGLIDRLHVVDEGESDADGTRFGVIAGGRRLLALQLLEQRGWDTDRIQPDAIPVSIDQMEEGREISLAENQKVAMNPADEAVAYAAIVADYEARGEPDRQVRIARLAHRSGRSVRHVEQRLRLAGLAPEILEDLRTEAITLEAARAYAAVGDQELQMQVYAGQQRQGEHRPASIRAAYAGKFYRAGDRQVLYVGIDAYVAAGGRIERDLFMGSELDQVLIDTALVDRLAREKAQPEADRLAIAEGYAGAELKGWGAASWSWPATPPGFQKVFSMQALRPADRPAARAIADISSDGSFVFLTDEGFQPAVAPEPAQPVANGHAQPAAANLGAESRIPAFLAPAAAPEKETELQRLSRIRRERIEAAKLRLAVATLPVEGRIFMPTADLGDRLPRLVEDGDELGVAVYFKVSKTELDRFAGEAEALVDHELGHADAPPAPRRRPEPDFDEDGPLLRRTGRKPKDAVEIAEWIEDRIADHGLPGPSPELGSEWSEYHRHLREFSDATIGILKLAFGAKYRTQPPDGYHLTVAGVSRSCTAGEFNLLQAWASKAKAAARVEEPAE